MGCACVHTSLLLKSLWLHNLNTRSWVCSLCVSYNLWQWCSFLLPFLLLDLEVPLIMPDHSDLSAIPSNTVSLKVLFKIKGLHFNSVFQSIPPFKKDPLLIYSFPGSEKYFKSSVLLFQSFVYCENLFFSLC